MVCFKTLHGDLVFCIQNKVVIYSEKLTSCVFFLKITVDKKIHKKYIGIYLPKSYTFFVGVNQERAQSLDSQIFCKKILEPQTVHQFTTLVLLAQI